MPTLDLEIWGFTAGVGTEPTSKPNPPLTDSDWAQRLQRPGDDVYAIGSMVARTTLAIETLRQEIYRNLSAFGVPQSYQPIYWYSYDELRRIFDGLRGEWKSETSMSSSTQDISMHAAYQRIIGLGRQAIPLVLRELQMDPDQWFWALEAVSRENPANEDDEFDVRVQKWINWGRDRGYLAIA